MQGHYIAAMSPMLCLITILALFVSSQACPPSPSGQPATMTFYTNQQYDSSREEMYVNFAKTQLQQMMKRYNIAYTEGMFDVKARNIGGKVAIVLKVPKVDCNLVPIIAGEVKKSNFLVTSAAAQCGNGPNRYV